LAGAPSALSSLMPIAVLYCSPGNATAFSLASQSGTTSEHSMAIHGEAKSMSSVADSHARTSARPAHEPGLKEIVPVSGESSRASLRKSSRRTSSSKTRHTFVLAGLSSSCKTLPAWGLMQDGVCSELKTSERPILEKGCGLLPTPTGADNEASPSMSKWPAHRWLMEFYARLPSPRATDANRGGRGDLLQAWRGNSNSHFSLPTPTAGHTEKVRLSLESLTGGPWISFREWMMGWPIGWTALQPLETGRFQEWRGWHGRH
jgi:hypothetical protein